MRLSDVGKTDCLDQLSNADETRPHLLGEVGKLAVYRVVECFNSPSHVFDYTVSGIVDCALRLMLALGHDESDRHEPRRIGKKAPQVLWVSGLTRS